MTLEEIENKLRYNLRVIGDVKNTLSDERHELYPVLKHALCQCFIILDYMEDHQDEQNPKSTI